MLRVRVPMVSTIGGGPYLATHYFIHGDTQADANAAVSATGTFWGAVDAVMDSQISWSTEPDVAIINPVNGELTGILATTPAAGAGAIASDSVPLAAQALIRWLSAGFENGRRVRGRTFVPGLTTTANTNGRVSSGTQATILAAANAFIADAGSALAVWSRIHGAAYSVSTTTVWSEFATLRSRRD